MSKNDCNQEFRTLRIDPRYPFQNQTKFHPYTQRTVLYSGSPCHHVKLFCQAEGFSPDQACFDNYCDYYRCLRLLGEADDCKLLKRYFETICPNFWIEHWDEQRQKGTFPARL